MFVYFNAPLPWRELARRTVVDSLDDGVPGLAAQLAFYLLLGLFPALLVLVSLLAYLPVEVALTRLLQRVDDLLPADVLALVRSEVDSLVQGGRGGLLTLGAAFAIWSSSSAMTAVIYTLNRAYDIEEWRPWWQRRLIAIGLTAALAVFSVAALALIVGGRQFAAWFASWIGAGPVAAAASAALQWPIAVALVIVAVDLIYHFAPNAETRWVWITPGSLLATALWLAASLGLKLYLRYVTDLSVVYGGIGSAIVLLVWLYLAGLAILIGAELNAEIDKALPSHDRGPQGPERKKKIGPAQALHGSAHGYRTPRSSLAK